MSQILELMSQRDGFGNGFLLGAVVGGLVGGLVGALATARSRDTSERESILVEATEATNDETGGIEGTRRSLETKIAQLNAAIDDVRQQLNSVNRNGTELEREYRER